MTILGIFLCRGCGRSLRLAVVLGFATLSAVSPVPAICRLEVQTLGSFDRGLSAEVVRHEVGHTFGLQHCPTPGCVMEDTKGSIKGVDSSDGSFCASCRAALGPYLRKR